MTMDLHSTTTHFIDDLQRHFNRTLTFPTEIGVLIEEANLRGMGEVFRDVMFQAKFATRTREIMQRIGRDAEGFDKLSTEFQNSVEKTSALLRTIVKESSEEIKEHFVKDFFGLDQSSFGNFINLLGDLNWVKNYELDGLPPPLHGGTGKSTSGASRDSVPQSDETKPLVIELGRIRNGAFLGLVLIILLFVVDPPVTFLGIAITIVVILLLLYVGIASRTLIRKSHSLF